MELDAKLIAKTQKQLKGTQAVVFITTPQCPVPMPMFGPPSHNAAAASARLTGANYIDAWIITATNVMHAKGN